MVAQSNGLQTCRQKWGTSMTATRPPTSFRLKVASSLIAARFFSLAVGSVSHFMMSLPTGWSSERKSW